MAKLFPKVIQKKTLWSSDRPSFSCEKSSCSLKNTKLITKLSLIIENTSHNDKVDHQKGQADHQKGQADHQKD
jgi:hypothetical protein